MKLLFWIALVCSFSLPPADAQTPQESGRVVDVALVSEVLKGNLIGIPPERNIKVYLPAGYDKSRQRYPVIYYFHTILTDNKKLFENGNVKAIFDKGIHDKVLGKVILVAGDFSVPRVGTFFNNAPESGRWLDHVSTELVPFIDKHYRTLADKKSRGLAGEHLGGYAALKLAMVYPDKFSSVYALHPFGTSSGLTPMLARPIWDRMNRATSWNDLDSDIYAQVFTAMAQSYLPNPDKPPFYTDFIVELKDNKLVPNTAHIHRLHSEFLLDQLVPKYAENLKQLTAIKFDWGRYDANPDHVFGNQAFARRLDEYGINHFSEEYAGNQWEKNWIHEGRVHGSLMPFFNRYLTF